VDFAGHAAVLSTEADARLGDLIQYSVDGAAFIDVKARIYSAEPTNDWAKNDEIRGAWRLRIAKAVVPSPSKNDRLTCIPILGDLLYRPIAKDPIDDGRYWLVDLEKVG
jgi:hypothetical protein